MNEQYKNNQKEPILNKWTILTIVLIASSLLLVYFSDGYDHATEIERIDGLREEVTDVLTKYAPSKYNIIRDEELKTITKYVAIDITEYPSERDVTVLLNTLAEEKEGYKSYTYLNDRSVTELYTIGLIEINEGNITNFDYIDEHLHNRLIDYRK